MTSLHIPYGPAIHCQATDIIALRESLLALNSTLSVGKHSYIAVLDV